MNGTQNGKFFSRAKEMIFLHKAKEGGGSQYCKRTYMFILNVNGTLVGDCWIQDRNLSQITESHEEKEIKHIELTIYKKALWERLGKPNLEKLVPFGF